MGRRCRRVEVSSGALVEVTRRESERRGPDLSILADLDALQDWRGEA